MSILQVYVDEKTMLRLRKVSEETGRAVEELAEAAVSDAALRAVPILTATEKHDD